MAERKPPVSYKLAFNSEGVVFSMDRDSIRDPLIALDWVRMDLMERMVMEVNFDAVESLFDDPSRESVVIAPPQPEPSNGKVTARLSDEGDKVLILVEPPMGRAEAATLKDALRAIKEAGGAEFFLDLERIDFLIASLRYQDYIDVGERRDGEFEFKFSKDMTEAYVVASPAYGGKPITIESVLAAMKENKIVAGINQKAIEDLFIKKQFHQPVLVAAGRPAENGRDAFLEVYFDAETRKAKPSIDEEGEVDFKELNLFQTVSKGTRLGKKHPATPGKKGLTVFGSVLNPRPGRDIPSPIGLNATFSPSEVGAIVAETDGQPKLAGHRICVVQTLEIPGDVDYSVGNLDFNGTVKIEGSVITGFSVKARGDILVGGSVEGATLEAEGSIQIRRGVVGQEKATLTCGGPFVTRFVDKAVVNSRGDVLVDESIMFSQVAADGDVLLTGKKGFIIGGTVRAGKVVRANQLGAPLHSPTTVEIGGNPNLRKEIHLLEAERQAVADKLEVVNKGLLTLEKRKAAGALDERGKERELGLTRERFALLSRSRAVQEKKEKIEERIGNINGAHLKLHVRDRVFPGVKIHIKNAFKNIEDELVFSTFYEREEEIEFMPYDGGDVPDYRERAVERGE